MHTTVDAHTIILGVIIIVACLIVSAFFAMTEAAVLSISTLKAKHIQETKGKSAEILKLWIKHPSLMLVALLIGNNLINIFVSVYTDDLSRKLFGKSSIVLISIIMTFIIVLFAEVIPKTFAKNFASEIAVPLLNIFKYFYYALWPISHLMTAISNTVQGWIFKKYSFDHPPITKEELQFFINVSEAEGIIPEQKHEMLSGVFEMSKTIAREIMVPRPDISAINTHTKINNSIDQFKETGHSRLPIYEDRIDNIVGIVHVKDALFFTKKHQKEPDVLDKATVMEIKRDVLFFPETKPIDQLFQEMRRQKQHFAVLLDEYGGTSGIVTMEDIFEEIVGEIRDEYDKEEESIHPTQNPNQFIADCKIHIDDFSDFFDLDLLDLKSMYPQDFDTLGGLILHHFEGIPKVHDKFSLANLDIEILEISKRRVRKVLVTIKNNTDTP